jgi:hypothetical protein
MLSDEDIIPELRSYIAFSVCLLWLSISPGIRQNYPDFPKSIPVKQLEPRGIPGVVIEETLFLQSRPLRASSAPLERCISVGVVQKREGVKGLPPQVIVEYRTAWA